MRAKAIATALLPAGRNRPSASTSNTAIGPADIADAFARIADEQRKVVPVAL
jgi:hypothetical protein